MKKRAMYVSVILAAILVATLSFGLGAQSPTKIVFWYSLGGRIADATRAMVDAFNAAHPNIQVEAIYQGSYDDSLNKFKAGIPTKAVPNVIQVYDIGTKFMIDSKAIVPMQKYIDRDKIDVSTMESNILAYYTVGNQLYSMPFNISTPLLYYNKDMFKAAGLDPDKPPMTFDEVTRAARALTTKDASGKVVRPGMAIAVYGWFFEQFLAAANLPYANNGNGRDSDATAVTFATPEAAAVIDWWNAMVKEGIAANLGRRTADTQKAFIAGQAAMTIDSTAVLSTILSGVEGAFQVGTGYLPRPAGAKGGVVPGGGCLWLVAGHDAAREAASWEFIKWMSTPEQQAKWHMATGYFPVTKLAYDLPAVRAHQAKFPQFAVAVRQLRDTPINRNTQGALLGVFTEARQTVEDAIEQVLAGRLTSLEALRRAGTSIDAAITRYNRTVGR